MHPIAHPAFSKGFGSFLSPSVTAPGPIIRIPPLRGCLKTIALLYIVFTEAETYSSLKATWTCALQSIQITARFEGLSSECMSQRLRTLELNHSLLKGEISNAAIPDYISHMPFLMHCNVCFCWHYTDLKHSGTLEVNLGAEGKRRENNLIPLTGYLVSSQLPVAAQDPGRQGAVLRERSRCWDLHAKCCLSHGSADYHSHSAPVALVTHRDTTVGLCQHVSVPTRGHHQRALAIAEQRKTNANPGYHSFFLKSFDKTCWTCKRAVEMGAEIQA